MVMGGPHVPYNSEDFFHRHPYVDLIVHHEGEVAFYEILVEFLKENPDYTKILGLSIRSDSNNCIRTGVRTSIDNLNLLPSPYLEGTFDHLMSLSHRWNASHETNRGCPYSCIFCDWGSSLSSKIREFDEKRLKAEIEWISRNRIEVLYNCDANYGILQRDYRITQNLVKMKYKFGFPVQFRPAYAKLSNNIVFNIAKLLRECGLQKGVTFSVQSMSENCLKKVKRNNLANKRMFSLLSLYRSENIPTYTEIILGLPGETYDSFKKGISKLIELGQHDGICVYMCEVLPNSEMANNDYRLKHGIKTKRLPLLLAYATPSDDNIKEYAEIVVATNDLSVNDWKKCFLFAWVVQCCHCLNLTQYLSIFIWIELKIQFDVFYKELLKFAINFPQSLLGQQYLLISNALQKGLSGKSLDIVVPQFGKTTWFTEEAAFLNIICNRDQFYKEIFRFMSNLIKNNGLTIQDDKLSELIMYQKCMLVDPYTPKEFTVKLHYDFPSFFQAFHRRKLVHLEKKSCSVLLKKDCDYRDDLETYALEIVRFGRKRGKLHHKIS
jgi:putative methyltransferase